MNLKTMIILFCVVAGIVVAWMARANELPLPPKELSTRNEVVFWHFWGDRDRDVVEDVVRRFNASQDKHFVQAIAMPGNNLQAKLFLSVTGGDPPDLVNQDDPILADWASRGVILSIDSIAPAEEVDRMTGFLFESARKLSIVDGRFFAVCNGLDIRALYFNKTLLDQNGLMPPVTTNDLDKIAETVSPTSDDTSRQFYAYVPDSRRLWAWGYVFGGNFFDAENEKVLADSKPIVSALNWMSEYSRRYGADNIAAFRQGDQSLPGKTFPLLPINDDEMLGRYGLIMDGQWRTRDIMEFSRRRKDLNIASPEFGVCPLPAPDGGRKNAGWVNGNFFVVPRSARNGTGAWEFIKFWVGLTDPSESAITCATGGWIPVSQEVVDTTEFQNFLQENKLFQTFVDLAASENQHSIPVVPGAAMFKRTVEEASYDGIMHPEKSAEEILRRASDRIQQHLERARQ